MENKKEPLMSADEWYYNQLSKQSGKMITNFEIAKSYANYVTQWHLNNAKDFVADYVKILDYTVYENGIDLATPSIDKQSIHTAIDNYIEINLNKEL